MDQADRLQAGTLYSPCRVPDLGPGLPFPLQDAEAGVEETVITRLHLVVSSAAAGGCSMPGHVGAPGHLLAAQEDGEAIDFEESHQGLASGSYL